MHLVLSNGHNRKAISAASIKKSKELIPLSILEKVCQQISPTSLKVWRLKTVHVFECVNAQLPEERSQQHARVFCCPRCLCAEPRLPGSRVRNSWQIDLLGAFNHHLV